MTDIGTRARSAVGNRNTVIVAVLIVLALIYPQIVDSLSSLPLIGDFVPKTDSIVVMIVFTTMAIGLNIVVGYAGLLDLGYVAFYAVGAYTAGWFASQQFDQVCSTSAPSACRRVPTVPGIHISMWLVLPLAGLLTMVAGILIGLPTLRLRGDYLAIVTLGFGEIVPQFVRNADNLGGFDLTHGTFGISPIDSLGFGAVGAAIGLPESFRQSSEQIAVVLLDRGRDPADHRLLQCPVARLAARPRLDRDPRGRDRRRGDGYPADAHEDVGVRDRGVLRRRRRRVLRELQGGAFPADFYFNISVFLLCMVILGGMGSVWGVVLGGMILGYLNVEGLATIGSKIQQSGVPDVRGLRPAEVPVRDLRHHHRADDAVPSRRSDPRAAPQDRDGGGCARHAVLRRAARGHAHRPGPVG